MEFKLKDFTQEELQEIKKMEVVDAIEISQNKINAQEGSFELLTEDYMSQGYSRKVAEDMTQKYLQYINQQR
jgi:hypothetical protein